MFKEIREKRGLVYSVYASYQRIPGHAFMVDIDGQTTMDNIDEFIKATKEVCNTMSSITQKELDKVVHGVIVGLASENESPHDICFSNINKFVTTGKIMTSKTMINMIKKITTKDIEEASKQLFNSDPIVTMLVPEEK